MGVSNDQLYGISRKILDSRRPDVPTEAEKEEGLLPYAPLVAFDSKSVLSYNLTVLLKFSNLQVYGIKSIISSSTKLESTSLVFAYGLDMFFTIDAPSGTFDMLSQDFSKGMLLATILLLAFGTGIAGPMVTK